MKFVKNILFSLLLVACSTPSVREVRQDPSSFGIQDAMLDSIVDDLCNKQIVLLGEHPSHAFGRSFELKSRIVSRLIENCGFNVFLIESGIYGYLNGTPPDLHAAIKPLWSETREFEPLIPFLAEKVRMKKLWMGGIDDQVDRNDTYARFQMEKDLTSILPVRDRENCLVQFQGSEMLHYPVSLPATEDALFGCLKEIKRKSRTQEQLQMAANLERMFLRSFQRERGAISEEKEWMERDRSMFLNVRWFLKRFPKNSKVIVWAANSHVAKAWSGSSGPKESLGSLMQKEFKGVYSVGFTAATGSQSMLGKPASPLEPAPADSIESKAFEGSGDPLKYLNHDQLTAYGNILTRALGSKFKSAPLDQMFDALMIIKDEHSTHSLKPQ